jgi:hypothetical protein
MIEFEAEKVPTIQSDYPGSVWEESVSFHFAIPMPTSGTSKDTSPCGNQCDSPEDRGVLRIGFRNGIEKISWS